MKAVFEGGSIPLVQCGGLPLWKTRTDLTVSGGDAVVQELEFIVVGIVALAIVVAVAFVRILSKASPVAGAVPKGPDPGGTFGGVPNIAPGAFNPGSAPPPTYEETEHVRAYEEQSPTPKEP